VPPIVTQRTEQYVTQQAGPRHTVTRTRTDEIVEVRVPGEESVIDTCRSLFTPTSYRNAKLPSNTRLHASSALAVAQLERMSRRASDPPPSDGSGTGEGTGTFVPVADFAQFTATLNIVGFAGSGKAAFTWEGQEHSVVPVYLMSPKRDTNPSLAKVMAGGFPIPPDWQPTEDGQIGDTHFCAWMPDYVSPQNRKGLYWEGWAMQLATFEERADWGTNPYHPSGTYIWKCWDGGRINGTDTCPDRYSWWTYDGYKASSPEHFDSTYREGSWGAVAAGNPLGSGLVTKEDCLRGVIDHAIDLITVNSKQGYWWPANRGDGTSTTIAFPTGARFRLPHDWVPQGPTAFCRMLEVNARDHGWKVGDKTGNCNKVRLEPGCETTPVLAGLNAASAIAGFPWGHLQMLDIGSDFTPNPTV
jgi:hypothetical protein